MHHFCFTFAIGKPYQTQWRFNRSCDIQQHPSNGIRKVTRFSFGWFRVEYSTYLVKF